MCVIEIQCFQQEKLAVLSLAEPGLDPSARLRFQEPATLPCLGQPRAQNSANDDQASPSRKPASRAGAMSFRHFF
ncbi:hypothetical protein [Tautonia marina]|uniref:hypothetical protein n=1 Tax=Tautonia marina TaxID=2653855 RepID=UPI0013763B30|nr:hypothetical protein [Tautonia marina]